VGSLHGMAMLLYKLIKRFEEMFNGIIKNSIGLIETKGFVGLVEAADAMVKAAGVNIIGSKRTGGGFAVIVEGNVTAVKVAVIEGALAAKRVGN